MAGAVSGEQARRLGLVKDAAAAARKQVTAALAAQHRDEEARLRASGGGISAEVAARHGE
jgi:hypothetical protein